ncbi:MAG: hypothetical protein PHW24_03270 [Candidatus Moranbacteria bacterium]|nr:hypothetical protein [Candidatus Moranbacteria bacterium]
MNIAEKIEEIRLQPEHVRMRWVWGSVTFCMLIIFAIWIFSISAMFRNQKNVTEQASDGSGIAQQLKDLQSQTPSLKDYAQQALPAGNEGITAPSQENSDFQYPATTETPQASGYSDLPTASPAQ